MQQPASSTRAKVSEQRVRRAFLLIAAGVFLLPFLPMLFPGSATIQGLLGEGRFVLAWLFFFLVTLPLAFGKMDRVHPRQPDTQPIPPGEPSMPAGERVERVLVIVVSLLFFFALPFLQVFYPDSVPIQTLLGRNRFILVWIILILVLLPGALRQMSKGRRAQTDQQTRGKDSGSSAAKGS